MAIFRSPPTVFARYLLDFSSCRLIAQIGCYCLGTVQQFLRGHFGRVGYIVLFLCEPISWSDDKGVYE